MYMSIKLKGCLIGAWDGKKLGSSWDPAYYILFYFSFKLFCNSVKQDVAYFSDQKQQRKSIQRKKKISETFNIHKYVFHNKNKPNIYIIHIFV